MSKVVKVVLRIIGVIAMLAAVAAGVWFLALNPYRGTVKNPKDTLALDTVLTREQAREDIDYVMDMLRGRHPAWLEYGNERVEAVEAMYGLEIAALDQINEGDITVEYEWQVIGRILHELYDGHTVVYASYSDRRYIDDFTYFYEYGVPVKIGEFIYEEALNRFLAVFPYEVYNYAERLFQNNVLCNESYLQWIGCDTSNGIDMTFETEEGEKVVHFDFVPINEVKSVETDSDEEDRGWVYYDIDAENSIGIFTLTDCNYNNEYKKTVKEFFTAVDEAGIDHIIVDLRYNGGGSSYVADEFLRYVDIDGFYTWPSHVRIGDFLIKNGKEYSRNRRLDPQFSGDLYVLTSLATFSAAMDFTMDVMDNDLGIVVGEASGNLPDSYGDILIFQLPNSRLEINVSYKRWFRTDETKTGQPLEPDYSCDPSDAMDVAYDLILNP